MAQYTYPSENCNCQILQPCYMTTAMLKNWFQTQDKSDFSEISSITMDMWDSFINAVKEHFPEAESFSRKRQKNY